MAGSCSRQLYVHLVWTTKDRASLIPQAIERELWRAIAGEAQGVGCRAVAVGGIEDHVHALVELSPTLSVAALAKQIKGATSHMMTREFHPLRWQDGYGAFTLRKRDVPEGVRYSEHQRRHHLVGNLARSWEPPADDPMCSGRDLQLPAAEGNPEGV